MEIKFDRPLINFNKEPIKDENAVIITLKSICVNALLTESKLDSVTGDEKLARYLLAQQISEQSTVDLSVEDISKIKKLVGMYFPPIIVGQAYLILEGKI